MSGGGEQRKGGGVKEWTVWVWDTELKGVGRGRDEGEEREVWRTRLMVGWLGCGAEWCGVEE